MYENESKQDRVLHDWRRCNLLPTWPISICLTLRNDYRPYHYYLACPSSLGVLVRLCTNTTFWHFMLLLQYNNDDFTMPSTGRVTSTFCLIVCVLGSYLGIYGQFVPKLCVHPICVFLSRLAAIDVDVMTSKL